MKGKTDGRKLKHEVLTELRRRAVERVQNGESPEVVVRALGFSRACIYNWLAAYRAGGWDGLKAGKRGGRPRKLNSKMIEWMYKMIEWMYKVVTGGDPRQYKFSFALWTRNAIGILIKRKYGIKLSANSVGRLLAQLGITPQKPLWRAYQQDAELVRRWLEEEYPRIEREAREKGAEIWFGDESGVRSDYHSGTTWGLKGQTPVVKTTGARYRLNMISAVNRKGKMRFMVVSGGVTSAVFNRFLGRLMAGNTRPVFLVLDGHPIHKSKAVSRKVESFNGRLRLFSLPPYSPELNPDEGVWREVKAHRLGRAGVFGFDGFKSATIGALRHVAKRPDKVRALFASKETKYAA